MEGPPKEKEKSQSQILCGSIILGLGIVILLVGIKAFWWKDIQYGKEHGVRMFLGIDDTYATVGRLFEYKINENAFQGHIYEFKTKSMDNFELPKWLCFNQDTQTFLGVPSILDIGAYMIEVEAIANSYQSASTTFLIQVRPPNHATEDRFALGNSERNLICDWDQQTIKASLLLDTHINALIPKERAKLIQRWSEHLSQSVQSLSLEPRSGESIFRKLDNNKILVAGPGDANPRTKNEGVDLSWTIACGEFSQKTDMELVLTHNIESGNIKTVLGYDVIGWYVTENMPLGGPEVLRKKRQATAFRTPLPTPSISLVKPTPSSSIIFTSSSIHVVSSISPTTSSSFPVITPTATVAVTVNVTSPTVTGIAATSETPSLPSTPHGPTVINTTPMVSGQNTTASTGVNGSLTTSNITDSVNVTAQTTESVFLNETTVFVPSTDAIFTGVVTNTSQIVTTDSIFNVTTLPSSNATQSQYTTLMTRNVTQDLNATTLSVINVTQGLNATTPSVINVTQGLNATTPTVINVTQGLNATTLSVINATQAFSATTPTVFNVTLGLNATTPSVINMTQDINATTPSVINVTQDLNATTPSFNNATLNATTPSIIDATMVLNVTIPGINNETLVLNETTPSLNNVTQDLGATTAVAAVNATTQSVINITTVMTTFGGTSQSRPLDNVTTIDPNVSQVTTLGSNITTVVTEITTPLPTLNVTTKLYMTTKGANESIVTMPQVTTLGASNTTAAVENITATTQAVDVTSISTNATVIPPGVTTQESVITTGGEITTNITTVAVDVTTAKNQVTQQPTTQNSNLTTSNNISTVQVTTNNIMTTVETKITTVSSNLTTDGTNINATEVTTQSSLLTTLIPAITTAITNATDITTVDSGITTVISLITTANVTNATDITTQGSGIISTASVTTEVPTVGITTGSVVTTVKQDTTAAVGPTTVESKVTTFSVTPKTESAPVVSNVVPVVNTFLGSYFQYLIPANTFYDVQDGNTRNLSLELLKETMQQITKDYWVQFNRTSQVIYGIPLQSDYLLEKVQTQKLKLKATDSATLDVNTDVSLTINNSLNSNPSFAFYIDILLNSLTVGNNQVIPYITEDIIKLVSKIALYFGDNSSQFVSLLEINNIDNSSVIVKWSNNSISQVVCQNNTILQLYSKIADKGELAKMRTFFLPSFAIKTSGMEWLGVCANNTGIPGALDTNVTVIIAAIIPIVIIILIIIIIICCIYCLRKRRQKAGRYRPDDEKPIFSNNRKPVILEGEFDVKDPTSKPRKPVFMEADTDPSFAYNNPGYVGPEPRKRAPPPYINEPDVREAPPALGAAVNSHPDEPVPYSGEMSAPYDLVPFIRHTSPPPAYRLPPPYIENPGFSQI